MLLHGATGAIDFYLSGWGGLLPQFAARYRAIHPELRGHCRTDNPAGSLSFSQLAADVGAFIERLGAGPAHIAGVSLGGIVGLGVVCIVALLGLMTGGRVIRAVSAAVLVLAGCAYFLWRRFRDREATTAQRLGYDFVPLIALVAISVTGLLLTLSSALLDGEGYEFLAIVHMATVVLTLVFIPFGKFFHVIQRPASVGVEVYKRTSLEREGVFACRRCGEPLEAVTFVRDLEETMDELGLRYGEWIETCPRCKRVERGRAYLREVNRGFR